MTHIIRSIEVQDLPQTYDMLNDLMRHENTGNPLKLTLARMKQELFGPKADWYGFVAAQGTEIIGVCLYSFANTSRPMNSTPLIYIDDLYVHPKYRRLKIAKSLIEEVSKIARQSHISRIELWCVKSNSHGQNFYQNIGAKKLDHIDVFRLDVDKLDLPENPYAEKN